MTELRDGFPDALVPEAAPVQLPSDAFQWETGASDASAGVLPDAMLDAPQVHSDAGVEKLVDQVLDVPAQVAQALRLELLAARRARVLCKPVSGRSAA